VKKKDSNLKTTKKLAKQVKNDKIKIKTMLITKISNEFKILL